MKGVRASLSTEAASLFRPPNSLLGKSAPTSTKATASSHRERPSSVTVLGKKIISEAVVSGPAGGQFHPVPISFEVAKLKQHFQRDREQDISKKPKSGRAKSAVNSKLLSKIKIYSQTDSSTRAPKKKLKEAIKKSRPPKAPRRPKTNKLEEVSRSNAEPVSRQSKHDDPQAYLGPRIDEIVQQSLRRSQEDKIRDEEARLRRHQEDLKRKHLLKQQNLKVRHENKRFQGNLFKPRTAWGIDERRLYGYEKARGEKANRGDKLFKRKRALSAGKDRIGTEALNEIKAELRSQMRSQSVATKPVYVLSGRSSAAKETRRLDHSVQDYMKLKKQEVKDLQEREYITHLAMEAKRLSQLRDLDVKAKCAIQKGKRKKKRTSKRRSLATSESITAKHSDDDEVDIIMNHILSTAHARRNSDDRGSRALGVLSNKGHLTEERGNDTLGLQSNSKYSDSYHLGSSHAPLDLRAELSSSHADMHLQIDSHSSSFLDQAEVSLYEDDEPSFQLNINKRRDEVKKKVAELQRLTDWNQLRIRDERTADLSISGEVTERTPLNLPVILAVDFETMMQEQAAVRIQSNIRRFLAILHVERLKADNKPEDLSFHDDLIELDNERSISSERLHNDQGEWKDNFDSQLDLLASSGSSDAPAKRSRSKADLMPQHQLQIKSNLESDIEDLNVSDASSGRQAQPRPQSRLVADSEGSDTDLVLGDIDSQDEIEQLLMQELQQMKDREQALEDVIEQQNSRHVAEEAKKVQLKRDLAELRVHDRTMLEEVALRSGASTLTELLSKLFDQRYKHLEEMFEGNSNALQEAISGDLPYFDQLEQCLKQVEEAKHTGRGEATSINLLLDHLIEKSDAEDISVGDTSIEAKEAVTPKPEIGMHFEKQRFEDEIKLLEQELISQYPSLSDRYEGRNRPVLKRQPFSGLFNSMNAIEKGEAEQSRDLQVESGDSDSHGRVLNHPFSITAVYLSTEEDLADSPKSHQESLEGTEDVGCDFPGIHKPLPAGFDEPEPHKTIIAPSPVKAPELTIEYKAETTDKISPHSKDWVPAKVLTPEKPKEFDEKSSPISIDGGAQSELIHVKPSSPEKLQTPEVKSPEKVVMLGIGKASGLTLDDIFSDFNEADRSLSEEASVTQVNIAGECIVDEVLELIVDETLHILEESEVGTQALNGLGSPSKSVEASPSKKLRGLFRPQHNKSPQQDQDVANAQRARSYEVSEYDPYQLYPLSDHSMIDSQLTPSAVSRAGLAKIGSDPSSSDATDQLTDEILDDLLKAELSSISQIASPPRDHPSLPQLPLGNLTTQPDLFSSYSADYALKTDCQAVLNYTNDIFASALKDQKQMIESNLACSLPTNSLQLLEQLQNSELTSYSVMGVNSSPVLPLELYIQIEQARSASSKRALLSPSTIQAVAEAGNIHNKMIFDCVNEALAKHRPYGYKGQPMPWSSNTRALAPAHVDLEAVMTSVKGTLRRWTLIQAGKLPTYDMVTSSGLVDEEYLQYVRAERLDALVSLGLLENDEEWVDYEHEETQTKLDLADIALDHLVTETLQLFQALI